MRNGFVVFVGELAGGAMSEAEIDERQNKRRLNGQEALRRGRFRASLMRLDLDPDVITTIEWLESSMLLRSCCATTISFRNTA